MMALPPSKSALGKSDGSSGLPSHVSRWQADGGDGSSRAENQEPRSRPAFTAQPAAAAGLHCSHPRLSVTAMAKLQLARTSHRHIRCPSAQIGPARSPPDICGWRTCCHSRRPAPRGAAGSSSAASHRLPNPISTAQNTAVMPVIAALLIYRPAVYEAAEQDRSADLPPGDCSHMQPIRDGMSAWKQPGVVRRYPPLQPARRFRLPHPLQRGGWQSQRPAISVPHLVVAVTSCGS